MNIGRVYVPSQLVLAPMAGVTDLAFRQICSELGAGLTVTEMVSAKALCYQDRKSRGLLKLFPGEHPASVQIFGSDPVCMAEAACLAAEISGADIVDINMGCPVGKIVSNGDGSALMRDPEKAVRVAEAVVRAAPVPVTVKMRRGWDKGSINAVQLAQMLEQAGVAAVAVHGRTRAQMYNGAADWSLIGEVKRNPRMRIPIIGNGDVCTAADARRGFEDYGVDAVMIGRATFGQPWIFKEIRDAEGFSPIPADATAEAINSPHAPLSLDWKLDVLKEQVRTSISRIDEYRGILHVRRHLAATPLFKGIPNFRQTRIAMLRAETQAELFAIMEEVRTLLHKAGTANLPAEATTLPTV